MPSQPEKWASAPLLQNLTINSIIGWLDGMGRERGSNLIKARRALSPHPLPPASGDQRVQPLGRRGRLSQEAVRTDKRHHAQAGPLTVGARVLEQAHEMAPARHHLLTSLASILAIPLPSRHYDVACPPRAGRTRTTSMP